MTNTTEEVLRERKLVRLALERERDLVRLTLVCVDNPMKAGREMQRLLDELSEAQKQLATIERETYEKAAGVARAHYESELSASGRALSNGRTYVADCRTAGAEAAEEIERQIRALAQKEG